MDGGRFRGARHNRLRRRWLPAGVLVIGVAFIGVSVAVGSGRETARAAAGTPTRSVALPTLGRPLPVERDDVGDPFVLPVTTQAHGVGRTTYVLYWTTDWRSNVPTAVSSDLTHWRRVADSLPVLPSWATPSKRLTWGPTVHRFAGNWVLYFSTRDAATGRECIGRAVSANPLGPFRDTSVAPLVCQAALGGDIDPSVVTTANGDAHLLWKNDGNSNGSAVGIWEQPLTSDGLSLAGSPVRLLNADQGWENGNIEGPAMLADSRGGWWLFFSGQSWQSDNYDTGVAWCAAVTGPCHDASSAPMLASTSDAVSPGGFDTFVAGDGRLWASYSAFPSRPANARAALAEDRVLEIAPVLSH